MIKDKTPIELAFGRPPEPIVDIETATPDQLRTLQQLPAPARCERKLAQMAMETYLQARQSEDLRRDLAQRLLPSQTQVYVPGHKVQYWYKPDKKDGYWVRARVASITGSMALLDGGDHMVRCNVTKLRRDPDPDHDIRDPIEPAESAQVTERTYLVETAGVGVKEYWMAEPSLSYACASAGVSVGSDVDLNNRFALTTSWGRQSAW